MFKFKISVTRTFQNKRIKEFIKFIRFLTFSFSVKFLNIQNINELHFLFYTEKNISYIENNILFFKVKI